MSKIYELEGYKFNLNQVESITPIKTKSWDTKWWTSRFQKHRQTFKIIFKSGKQHTIFSNSWKSKNGILVDGTVQYKAITGIERIYLNLIKAWEAR